MRNEEGGEVRENVGRKVGKGSEKWKGRRGGN